MKSCPACHRTYTDDTFTFCLDDGALLTAPYYNPQATLQIPAARETDPPRTEILNLPSTHGDPRPSSPQATARASDPFSYPQEVVAHTSPQRQSGKASKLVGGVIVVLTAGVLLLGYIVWRGNRSAASETLQSDANVQGNVAVATPTAPVSSNVNVNADGVETPKVTGDPSSPWLDGVWEGTGHQNTPEMTWSIKLTAENNTYAIEYPSLRCGGKWTLVEMGESSAKFKEAITRGLERCSSDGDILVEKISDDQVSYKYTLPFIGEVATATLRKGASR